MYICEECLNSEELNPCSWLFRYRGKCDLCGMSRLLYRVRDKTTEGT